MSIDATRWAWMQGVRPTHKLVLLSLADRANDNNECYPSISRLEKDTGLYRETIMEAVSQLETDGLLVVSRAQGKGNRYKLIGVEMRENQSGKADRSGKADQSGKAEYTSLEKPTTTSLEKPTQNLPIEPSITTSNKSAPATRLPADWLPSVSDIEFCKTTRPDLDPFAIADGFRDYWIAAAGAKGRKADWSATWRNWIRNQRAGPARYETDKDRSRREVFDVLCGGKKNEPAVANERDITGFAFVVD